MDKIEVKVMKNILDANTRIAEELRKSLATRGILGINLMSSPGSGKTTLMEYTAGNFSSRFCVIEGDIQTTLDAERLARLGVLAYQINTGPFGGDCHLEAAWVKAAVDELDLTGIEYLFIENIGNLICPAVFDLGTHASVVMLSVTEGPEKPLKYPLIFRNSQICVVSKTDLLPHLDVSMEEIRYNIKCVNPAMEIIEVSSKTGSGMKEWFDFLKAKRVDLLGRVVR